MGKKDDRRARKAKAAGRDHPRRHGESPRPAKAGDKTDRRAGTKVKAAKRHDPRRNGHDKALKGSTPAKATETVDPTVAVGPIVTVTPDPWRSGGGKRRAPKRPHLNGISEIRAYLRTNQTPIHFISPTPFNLLGLDRWVRNLYFIGYYDCFEGSHPRAFVPNERPWREFQSIEEINAYLLGHKEVGDFIRSKGPGGLATFLMFDEEEERLAPELGLRIIHPSAALRHRVDSKTVTVRLGNDAGIPSAPNVLGRATSYRELLDRARKGGLGEDLVVQAPYGDSGRTTYFIKTERDWKKAEKTIAAEPEVKIMRRLNCRSTAIEATITRHGTIVGPLMTELIGHKELTPYKGGWCGNDMWPGVLSEHHRRRARKYVRRLGDRLAKEGYRGYFEVDVLADIDSGELYLGEINPRISGVTSMTNATAGAYADLPLFGFHLLEFMDVDYEIDVDDINHRWAQAETVDVWSQLIIKEPEDRVELLTSTPRTGVWRIDPLTGRIHFGRWANDWHSIVDEDEAFFLRILPTDDYRYKGADLGVLVSKSRMQTDDFTLTERSRQWIAGIRDQYAGTPVTKEEAPRRKREPFAFKFA
jgi:biotin carboxylase